MPNDTIVEMEH
jgi:hypothetical protein